MTYGKRQSLCRAGAFNAELAHVADIKNTGMVSGMQVFRKDSFILDGHEPAGERGHLGALGFMPGG